ncbi:MAG: transglutaminase TgpA family protein [Gallionellaceae bacterium]
MKLSKTLIYGLTASILLVSAPHAEHLHAWVLALCVILLAWRTYLTWAAKPLPSRWLLMSISVAGASGIFFSFHTLFGREAGVTLLILLATLKLLELRAMRDAMVLVFLANFIIITNFFYSQSIPTALFMMFSLLVIMATWVHMYTGTLALKSRMRIAAVLLLQAIPLTLLLFVLFPRVQGPLWGMPQDAYSKSGLDDNMSPGSMSKLSLSDAVAFRVTFTGTPPNHAQMYWRGPVLWDFDGRTWTRGYTTGSRPPHLDNLGNPSDYTVTLEPHNKSWLFALDMPTRLSIPATQTYDFQMLSKAPVNARIRYDAHSQLIYRANLDESTSMLQRALSLPPGFNPRARDLARQWRAEQKDDEAIVRTALSYFNHENFVYTLEPPLLGANSVDDFLFVSRKGFCEHYASSFVFLMRAAGIPARVVTGYQGAEFNQLGGYYIVRQSDAHAWAEVWLKDRGWVRTDPTAAISPARIQSGLNIALPNDAALPFFSRTQIPLLLKLRFNIDALTNQWNQWVLGYDTERQFAFLTRLGMENISWQKMAINLLAGVAILLAIFAFIMLRRLYANQLDPAQKLYLAFCHKLAKGGLYRAAHEGPQDFAARAVASHPQLATAINDITARYIALRYEKYSKPDSLNALRREIATFKL